MKSQVFIEMIPISGPVHCGVPGCTGRAIASVSHFRPDGEESWWDARASGPYCQDHLKKIGENWVDCEVYGRGREGTAAITPCH